MSGTTVRRSPGRKGTPQAEPQAKLPQTVAEVLRKHVVLELESIDRRYLNVFVSRLQILEGALHFIRHQRNAQVLSTKAIEPMTRAFVAAIEPFARQNEIPLITFEKGRRKDEVAAEMRAQSTALVNQYYFYCVDPNFGPFFLKFCSYFPYHAKLCLNGHEYAKRRLEREKIAYQALDNGIQTCTNAKRLQAICEGLSADKIDALLRKWLQRLPHPFPARDRQAGCDSRKPGYRPSQAGPTDLRSERDQNHSRQFSHSGYH